MFELFLATNLICPALLGIAMARRAELRTWAWVTAVAAFVFQVVWMYLMVWMFFGGIPDRLDESLVPYLYFLPIAVTGLVAVRLLLQRRAQ